MITSNQISPGITIEINGKIFRVESSVKVSVSKGSSFIKTKLRDLINDKISEKNFKIGQDIKEVALEEHTLEYLYPEGKDYLFFDIDNLEHIKVSVKILKKSIDYLKESIQVKAMFYGESIFDIELPQFLELMVTNTVSNTENSISNTTKKAVLETGAEVSVPLFIEVGDIIKVDVHNEEYIQRV
jgi:elongation factor P